MTLRSEGWSVRPSFSPHGPTTPVTLLFDDAGFTQLAGEPSVAWQTPWSEVTYLRLVRRRRATSIVMVVANTLYQWRRVTPLERAAGNELAATLTAHGARETVPSRRNAAIVVAIVVSVASFGGYFASLATPASTPAAVRALEAINLNSRDVSGTWASTTATNTSELQTLMPPPGQVMTYTSSSSTGAQDSAYTLAAADFERCTGVEAVNDRIFGLAAQFPLYDVSSPVFYTPDDGGIQVESDAQYYPSTQDVAEDVAQMSPTNFGRCYAQASADELVARSSSASPDLTSGFSVAEHPFVKGWVRAGAQAISLPLVGVSHATLVVVVEAAGHYEVTLAALVGSYSASRASLDNLVNALMVGVTSTSAVAT